jgi:tetratricopeptide (TPR) repeat protein
MGDLKKLKLILNKKFEEFKDAINIEGDSKKDASDALRFFNYALNNNPYNTRIYSNLGYVYREFLQDYQNSVYWFIRALSCVDNDLKKIKDNLEKDFNTIRKKFLKNDYIVDTNIGFLKYDLEYFPILFYRIQGILYMNIDVDKLENLLNNFNLIMEKILQNYPVVPDFYKFGYEINGQIEQMVILSIFNFHHTLNSNIYIF